ncbi:chlorite dismutase family protein [Paenibacillus filicis]|uniref:Coproheme decarboxylase n=1 Tax=Paenibacillus gyeongsangnamensis TaxID=3388067 RepID=A0ABT4Q4E4_9BACL|nr:chlorite dismutase family protein [Paenibacillus filicis]MCZ8511693.1 chlorite dismutase family protein [Paenibacillus filicis]
MNKVTQTLDGWYTLHDFRSINWNSWKKLSIKDRQLDLNELRSCLKQWGSLEEQKLGSTAIYTIVGQKADFYFLHMRDTLEELNELENKFNKTSFADHTTPVYSYLSVVELSNYITKSSDSDPLQNPEIIGGHFIC